MLHLHIDFGFGIKIFAFESFESLYRYIRGQMGYRFYHTENSIRLIDRWYHVTGRFNFRLYVTHDHDSERLVLSPRRMTQPSDKERLSSRWESHGYVRDKRRNHLCRYKEARSGYKEGITPVWEDEPPRRSKAMRDVCSRYDDPWFRHTERSWKKHRQHQYRS